MAADPVAAGTPALHEYRVPIVAQPLHNSIPRELLPRYDPVYVAYYNAFNAGRLHSHEVPIEEFRKNPARYTISYGRASGPDIFRITEQRCPVDDGEITIRIFEPAQKLDEQGQPKKRAAYINFHGGGWVFGGLAYDHDFCKRLVHGLDGDLVVFDVDYRLAPEYKYPIPVNDCWAAFKWILTVPVTDLHRVFTPEALPAARMAYFHRHFLGVPRPAESDENLAPALISTAELDPLRDEGEAYAAKLQAAGVSVEVNRIAGAPHIVALLDGILEGGWRYNEKVLATMQQRLKG
ncbi:CAZyme family CE10 [Penicillium bovifimosum]|uniref:CAZyme family CE10 n=1 Tax=Penicillium bovifimosum TaxID=126998 RepID=A0A9W9L9K1_9EURO|nr:CAZyme family CE10 [Penicillium bovifimosum]KAJ5143507.1 CAZyme family CE10 [Penicillium bovifimosum]